MSKIVFITSNIGLGGAQKMVRYLANLNISWGNETYIIPLRKRINEIEPNPMVKVIRDISNKDKNNHNILKKILFYIKSFILLRRIINDIKPDIICAFNICPAACAMLCSSYKTKLVFSERGDPDEIQFFWKPFVSLIYGSCNVFVCQSPGVKKYFNKKIQNKSIIIPNPYIEEYKELKPIVKANERCKIIWAASARHEPNQGFDTLIKAYYKFIQFNKDYKLIIFGSGIYKKTLEVLSMNLNLMDNIEFREPIQHIASKMRNCRMFVLPIRHAGMPNILMESLGEGIPCIASDSPPGGINYITNNGERAILVQPDNIDQLFQAMKTLATDDELSDYYSQKGKEIRKEFSYKKISDLWLRVFRI